ncbi:MAG: cardiolipin synthase B [Acidobacteria bacterium]|nr:cardiolipin synthase B [Acidobacteriota bacterium]MCW5967040.1 hypothetical protein [Blastocatellales bacterium]
MVTSPGKVGGFVAGRASSMKLLANQALSRAAGAPLIPGNCITLLKDGAQNYPAWISAIAKAEKSINFESYIIHEDSVGLQFADALMQKAREGVSVRVLYDWVGGLGKTSSRFWRRMRDAGVEVRCFNPPHFTDPFAWVMRDHRKTIVVDGTLGYVTGLCVGRMWVGDIDRGVAPWRDTGVEVKGPAVADITQAFARAWETAGPPLPQEELISRENIEPVGDALLRVIATEPEVSGLYRLDQLITAISRERLWLTDAYFAATPSYLQSLIAAARDGVDVRLLVPGASDIPVLRALSRVGYRPLLEGGIRVFEWNGPMIHAKTAVADSHWARVGSTNLNLASWLSNWELDVAVEDDAFAVEMEEMYLDDLMQSTEIVLSPRKKVIASNPERGRRPRVRRRTGSAGRVVAGALSLSKAVDAALTNQQLLGIADAKLLAAAAALLAAISAVSFKWPRAMAYPLGFIIGWFSLALLLRAWRLKKRGAPGQSDNKHTDQEKREMTEQTK